MQSAGHHTDYWHLEGELCGAGGLPGGSGLVVDSEVLLGFSSGGREGVQLLLAGCPGAEAHAHIWAVVSLIHLRI